MGQSFALPIPTKLPGRKSDRTPILREYNDDGPSCRTSVGLTHQRSSLGARLRNFAALLHRPPSPMSSSVDSNNWEEAASAPSSVENDVLDGSCSTSSARPSVFDTLASSFVWDRSIVGLTPTSHRPRTPATPSSLFSSTARMSASVSASDAIVPVFSASRLASDRLGSSASALAPFEVSAISTASSTSTALVRSALQSRSPVVRHQGLPPLRLGELEQIFAAIVTSDGSGTRTKLPLSC